MFLRIELSEFADRLNEKNGKDFWNFTKTMGLILLTFSEFVGEMGNPECSTGCVNFETFFFYSFK